MPVPVEPTKSPAPGTAGGAWRLGLHRGLEPTQGRSVPSTPQGTCQSGRELASGTRLREADPSECLRSGPDCHSVTRPALPGGTAPNTEPVAGEPLVAPGHREALVRWRRRGMLIDSHGVAWGRVTGDEDLVPRQHARSLQACRAVEVLLWGG